ncbi:MAG: hypothetical protein KatS3mg065_0711 [Chloroflexota bacterium]|nr:MAG: hypothetical protein KatS3mg065_0711 [Chloroflexota bacterium]
MTTPPPIDHPDQEGARPARWDAPTAAEPQTPATATAPDGEPPPPEPPATAESGPPPRGPREPGRGRRDLPIFGLVLVLLGLGLLLERLLPGLALADVWPYGSIALGLALALASVRAGSERGG